MYSSIVVVRAVVYLLLCVKQQTQLCVELNSADAVRLTPFPLHELSRNRPHRLLPARVYFTSKEDTRKRGKSSHHYTFRPSYSKSNGHPMIQDVYSCSHSES